MALSGQMYFCPHKIDKNFKPKRLLRVAEEFYGPRYFSLCTSLPLLVHLSQNENSNLCWLATRLRSWKYLTPPADRRGPSGPGLRSLQGWVSRWQVPHQLGLLPLLPLCASAPHHHPPFPSDQPGKGTSHYCMQLTSSFFQPVCNPYLCLLARLKVSPHSPSPPVRSHPCFWNSFSIIFCNFSPKTEPILSLLTDPGWWSESGSFWYQQVYSNQCAMYTQVKKYKQVWTSISLRSVNCCCLFLWKYN